MIKHLITLAFGLFITPTVLAQDTITIKGPWKYDGPASLNFSQVSLTNWAQGGESSYVINGLAAINLNYNEGGSSWNNSIDIGYVNRR